MKGITHHAKIRINERGNNVIDTRNKSLAKNIRKNGMLIQNYQKKYGTTPLVRYINSKKKAKPFLLYYIYLNYVVIFTPNGSKMITLYRVPEEFKKDEEMAKEKQNFYFIKTEKELKHYAKRNGKYKILIKMENDFEERLSFDDLDYAKMYAVEQFLLTDVEVSYLRENGRKSYKRFYKYLESNSFVKIKEKDDNKENSPISENIIESIDKSTDCNLL